MCPSLVVWETSRPLSLDSCVSAKVKQSARKSTCHVQGLWDGRNGPELGRLSPVQPFSLALVRYGTGCFLLYNTGSVVSIDLGCSSPPSIDLSLRALNLGTSFQTLLCLSEPISRLFLRDMDF